MAKQFAGFTPDQLGKIVPEMAGMQGDEQQKFLASNPAAAARVGKLSEIAQQRIGMAYGGYVERNGFADGGLLGFNVGLKSILDRNRNAKNNATKVDTIAPATAVPDGAASAISAFNTANTANMANTAQRVNTANRANTAFNTAQQQNMTTARANAAFQTPQQMSQGQQMPSESERQFQQDMQTRYQNFEQSNRGALDAAQNAAQAIQNKVLADFGFKNGREANNASEDMKRAINAAMDEERSRSAAIQNVISLRRDFEQTLPQYNPIQPQNQFQSIMPTSNTQSPQSDAQVNLDAAQKRFSDSQAALQAAREAQAKNPGDAALVKAVKDAESALTLSQEGLTSAQTSFKTTEMPNSSELMAGALNDPTSMVTKTDVVGTPVNQNQLIDPSTGQLTGPAPTVDVTSAGPVSTAADPNVKDAVTVDTTLSTPGIEEAVSGMTGATGEVSKEVGAEQGTVSEGALADTNIQMADDRIQKLEAGTRDVTDQELIGGATLDGSMPDAEAATFDKPLETISAAKFDSATPQADPQDYYELKPTEVAKMTATNVEEAAKASEYPTTEAATTGYKSLVEGAQGVVGSNELVKAKDIVATAQAVEAVAATMDALNQDAVAKAAQGSFSQTMLAQAAQGSVPAEATVSGQLDKLMAQFNDGTPSWAKGAIRAANAAMNARGIMGSSMASAAVVQAALESALPIAQADAAVFERMNMKNLDNRQQVSLTNAAAQQGMELQNLSNAQAAALQNSTNAFALQSQSLSNQQAVVLANAQFKAGLQEQVLNIDVQTSLANASKYAERNNLNLNNKQQALLQRSSENLSVEMANLSNTQQTALSALQVKAALMGQELTNEQQMAVLESTQRFEAAKFDASSKQQAFLQDAAAQAALEGKALDARQQTQLFNISSILEERGVELTNEQQTRIFNTTNRVTVDVTEMSNRQQTALANVQIEATLRGQELNNKQQAAVLNAEKFAEANNLTYSTEAQMQLANSQMMQTIGLAEMDHRSAAALQNAATIAAMDTTNLNNRQLAQVENAKNFLQMDMANLNNEQQTSMFKMQSVVNSMLSDAAAENASKQFNASSQMQTDQFFANLTSTIGMFNSEQSNKMGMFDAGEANAVAQFNSELINMRDQFNAGNSLIIEQANTNWFQTVATNDTAAINEANRLDAAAANNMTNLAFNAVMQETRDLMSFLWQTENNDADRATQLSIAKISSKDAKEAANATKKAGLWAAMGTLGAAIWR